MNETLVALTRVAQILIDDQTSQRDGAIAMGGLYRTRDSCADPVHVEAVFSGKCEGQLEYSLCCSEFKSLFL
jgi:hypothetical protein